MTDNWIAAWAKSLPRSKQEIALVKHVKRKFPVAHDAIKQMFDVIAVLYALQSTEDREKKRGKQK